ncbi:MAG: VanZ family protein [Verrucomicrobiales bacterium]|nr:VanZ family protein [Verrucomicrobiales bacterium]
MTETKSSNQDPASILNVLKHCRPVLVWMLVIFMASTSLGTSEHSKTIIRATLAFLHLDVSPHRIHTIDHLLRKLAHGLEYGILALLVWRARRSTTSTTHLWVWKEFFWIVGFAMFYASTDEFHQLFVASRTPSFYDVLIDTSGAAMMLLAVWFWKRAREIWDRETNGGPVSA